MWRKVIHVIGQGWLTGKSSFAKLGRVAISGARCQSCQPKRTIGIVRHTRFHPALEALECRELLSFAAPVTYSVGAHTTQGLNGFGPQVITADFNTDGNLDLAVTNTADDTVSILLGNGNGTFQPAVSYNAGLGSSGNPVWLAAADFNGDGKLDIAVEGNNDISILLGNGDGTFAAARTYSTGSSSGNRGGLAVGDYFGNGRQDLAVTVFGNNTVAILPNNGDGTFGTPIALPMPAGFSNLRSIAAGNFFGNGYADLAVAGGEGYNNVLLPTNPAGVALFRNDGAGHFTFSAKYLAVTTPDPGGGDGQGDTVNPEHVDAADLTHSGRLDLVLSLYDHNIDVFLNNGDGTFQPAVGYTTETAGSVGGYPRGVAFADVNGDGNLDIVTLNFGEPVPADQPTPQPGSLGVLYGNGDGTFQAPIQYTPYTLPGGVAVGDFNGDGFPDLAVTQNYDGHSVAVMLNQPNTANDAPTVTSVDPAAGPTIGGTVVTITGTNFTGATQVYFGTVSAASFTVDSDTSITATAPAHAAATVDITVYNAGASATSVADAYTFQPSLSTWTGLGTTNNWSDAANWSAGSVPDTYTTVIFDGTSSKDAIVDSAFAGAVAAVQINIGSTGTVSLNENLTVTGAFTQQAGAYDANGYATIVTGLTTVSGGTYLASTNTQTFTNGLTVSGGTFTGSTGTVTTLNVTLSSGTLNAPAGILTVAGGNFTYTGGTFNADLGTVTYTGTNASPTVSIGTGSVQFYNFQDAMTNTFPAGLTITGTLTVTGTFTWRTGSGIINGNIEAQGDVDDQNHGGTGNPCFTLDGAADQTIKDTSGGGGGFLRTLTINKPSGAVSLACNPLVYANFSFSAGTVNTGPYAWRLGGQGPVSAAPGLNLGNIEIGGANVTVSSTSLKVANITFAAAGAGFTAPAGNLFVSGNWDNSAGGTFTANGGTVVFDGDSGTQLLTSGGQAFNNLTIAAGATLELEADVTIHGVFDDFGVFLPNGYMVNP
jgi:hypothetical protein